MRTADRAPGQILADLLGSVSVTEFLETYHERGPLLVRAGDRTRFDRFLSLDDVDHVLGESHLHSDYVRIAQDGKSVRLRDAGTADENQCEGGLEALFQQYRRGASIVLLSLHERWRPLQDLCRSLTAALSARMQANVYLTPPHAQALSLHYDTHDVFVLQVHGAKHWRLYEPWNELPLPTSDFTEPPSPPRLVDEFVLDRGDLLYLPRGHPHEVRSGDATSLHITLGVKPVLWAEVIEEAMRAAIDGDPALRRRVPPGFATDPAMSDVMDTELRRLLDVTARRAPVRRVLDNARLRCELAAPPSLRGHLRDLDRSKQVDLDTVVAVRRDSGPTLTVADAMVTIGFHGKRVRLPGHTENTLRYMLAAPTFTAADLPADLDEASRLLLVGRLIHEGLLVHPAAQ